MATEYIKTVECPKCRYKNVAGTKFCADCGTALKGSPIPCGKCGTENPPDAKFCPNCGNNLDNPQENDPDIRHLQEALRGRYVVQKSLGEGGFGRVFLAEHLGLKQRHVIKLLSADSSRSTDIRSRFFQEAQVIARLKHPNIVPIMDVAEFGGRPYYTMSYIEGGSLAELLLKEKKLPTHKAINIVAKLLSALSEVHGKGIIHRDLKPDNVLLETNGEPILIDFGIARVEEGSKAKTGTGFSIGTPVYMSPEQLDAKPISLTTDIYSMGIMLYELLTGNPPYEGSMSSLITQHNTAQLPSVSGKIEESHLSDGIQTVLQKACAKEPSARYRSAKEMREAVEGILKIKEGIPEPKKISDTQKEEKPSIPSIQETQPEQRIIEENIPKKETDQTEQTYQDRPLLSESSVQKKGKIYGVVMALVLVLLGGYFILNQERQPEKDRQLVQTRNSIGIEFTLIPSGSFQMGCSDGDDDCLDDEIPQHKVTISNSFYMGKYEVTQGQWKRVMGNNPSYFQNCGENCPVEQVSWNDAQEFIKKLCELEKMSPCKYRLPTEAEWEYAARAGSKTKYYWGDTINEEYLWYEVNSESKTHTVGKKKPNAWGLYDMIGNVWEWNQDWYDSGYYERGDAVDPRGSSSGSFRVLRGGSWYYAGWSCRSSNRFSFTPDLRIYDLGFRLARTP